MNNGLKITGMIFSLIILVVTLPAYGVSPVKDPIEYKTTTDDSMIECKFDQTLVFHKNYKSYICLDNDTVIQWMELGLVELVGNKTISTNSEIESAGCQEGFLPIFRYEFEGVICTPEQTANLWAELGIATIVEISVDKPVVCGENMVSVLRDSESSKSSNKIVCVSVDTAERWIASGTATLVGFEAIEKVVIEEPEMIEEVMTEPIEEMVDEEMVEETTPPKRPRGNPALCRPQGADRGHGCPVARRLPVEKSGLHPQERAPDHSGPARARSSGSAVLHQRRPGGIKDR